MSLVKRAKTMLRSLVARARGGGQTTASLWGFGLELTTLVGIAMSFILLGRTLGPAGYGGYASLYAVIGPLVTLAASGVTLALLQHAIRDGEPLGETARSCVSLALSIGTALTFVGGAIAFAIVNALTTAAIVSILLTEFVTTPLIFIAAGTTQAGDSYIGAAKIRLQYAVGRIVLLVILFATDNLTVTALGVTQLILSGTLGVISLRRVGRRFGFSSLPGRIHFRHLKTDVIYSAAISAYALQNDGDKTVLAANKFVVDTGLYSAAYRIVLLGMVPVSSVVEVSHKRFLEHGEGSGHHLRLAFRYGALTAAYGLVFMAAILVGAPLLPVILGDEFEGSVEMLRWLSPLILLRVLAIFPLNGLMGIGRTALRTGLIMVVAAMTMTMYIVLIPTYGWEGAVAGTLIGDGLLVICAWAFLIRCQRTVDARPRLDPSEHGLGEALTDGSWVDGRDPADR